MDAMQSQNVSQKNFLKAAIYGVLTGGILLLSFVCASNSDWMKSLPFWLANSIVLATLLPNLVIAVPLEYVLGSFHVFGLAARIIGLSVIIVFWSGAFVLVHALTYKLNHRTRVIVYFGVLAAMYLLGFGMLRLLVRGLD